MWCGVTRFHQFHGSYQQDHREKRAFGEGKFYQFMMRTRQPAGKARRRSGTGSLPAPHSRALAQVTNRLYLTMDDLADKYGNGTLRLTTRQTYQLHGVLKGDLKARARCEQQAASSLRRWPSPDATSRPRSVPSSGPWAQPWAPAAT